MLIPTKFGMPKVPIATKRLCVPGNGSYSTKVATQVKLQTKYFRLIGGRNGWGGLLGNHTQSFIVYRLLPRSVGDWISQTDWVRDFLRPPTMRISLIRKSPLALGKGALLSCQLGRVG